MCIRMVSIYHDERERQRECKSDRWTDGRTDGQTLLCPLERDRAQDLKSDRQTDGQTDTRKEGRKEGRKERTDGRTDGRTDSPLSSHSWVSGKPTDQKCSGVCGGAKRSLWRQHFIRSSFSSSLSPNVLKYCKRDMSDVCNRGYIIAEWQCV